VASKHVELFIRLAWHGEEIKPIFGIDLITSYPELFTDQNCSSGKVVAHEDVVYYLE
jgi:hypothetical protein